MNNKLIVLDMDGTLADFYNVPNWLESLKREDPAPYIQARPMWNMERLREALLLLQEMGYHVSVVTWLAKNSTPSFDQKVRKAKMEWLLKYEVPFDSCHIVKYGTTKRSALGRKGKVCPYGVLIDDNEGVRNGWTLGATVNPLTQNIVEELQHLASYHW